MSERESTADKDAASPTRKRPLRKRVWFRLLVFAAVLWVAWCLTLFFCQDWLIFPADVAPAPLPRMYDATTVELTRPIEGGEVVAWFIPGDGTSASEPGPLVVFCHGNAELIDYQSDIVEGYRRLGCSILMPEYRGYGRSDGHASQTALVDDAAHFHDKALRRPEVDASRIVIHGRSLGGAVAAALARKRKPVALVLESTFTSLGAMAHRYAVPAFVVRHPFSTGSVVESLDVPILVFHGSDDVIIPVSHGRRLGDMAHDGTYVEYACGHNDFPGAANEADYWRQIETFLRKANIISGSQ